MDGRLAPVVAGEVVRDGVRAELTAADLDAIAHHPRVGYPKLTDAQLAEVLRKDEERWRRHGRKLVQQSASSPYRDPRRALRLR